ncbi:unnamed protein product, partial [Ectocarpus sp. 12 AP-2014]
LACPTGRRSPPLRRTTAFVSFTRPRLLLTGRWLQTLQLNKMGGRLERCRSLPPPATRNVDVVQGTKRQRQALGRVHPVDGCRLEADRRGAGGARSYRRVGRSANPRGTARRTRSETSRVY